MKHRGERRKLDIGCSPAAQHVTNQLFNHHAGFQRVSVGDPLKLPAGCRAGKRGVTADLAHHSQLFGRSKHRVSFT